MFKYQEILAAIAERAKVSDTPWDIAQMSSDGKQWVDVWFMPPLHDESLEYRLKPRTIKIGNCEAPAPIKPGEITDGGYYWFPEIHYANSRAFKTTYLGTLDDNHRINNNLAFKTEADAVAMTEALLGVLNGQ